MKVSKWVDMSQEVEVDIGADDVRVALAEAFDVVTKDRLGEPGPNRNDILLALNSLAGFLNAITDEQIGLLMLGQRTFVAGFLDRQAKRFKVPETA